MPINLNLGVTGYGHRKIQKHIEIVSSSISEYSSMGKKSREAILDLLSQYYSNVGITIVNTVEDMQELVAKKPDLVFLGMKFVPLNQALGIDCPDKVWVTEYLEMHGIAYTGSSQPAHELELNKPLAKQRVLDFGLKTATFYVARQNKLQKSENMPISFPVFIKPTNRGGGLGIDSNSVAYDFDQLQSKVQSIITNHHSDSLVEEYLSGREFSVAILKDESSPSYSIMPIEKIAPLDEHGQRILSGHIKTSDTARDAEVTDQTINTKITALAISVFHAIGARDYGRIDIRFDEFGTPQFLEANLLPSLIKGYGSFPKACILNIGMDYDAMLLRIVRLGLDRSTTITTKQQQRALVSLLHPARAL